jgi:hypothetical protein
MTEARRTDTGSPDMVVGLKIRKMFVLGVVIVFTLACNILGSDPQNMAGRTGAQTPLPTLTPTTTTANPNISSQETPSADSIGAPVANADPPGAGTNSIPADPAATLPAPVTPDSEQTNTDIPGTDGAGGTYTPEPTLAPVGVPGWTFANVHSYPDPYGDGILVYGDIVNGTGSVQELVVVTGTFFDAQGQQIAGPDDMVDYWPFDIVPVNGQLPFELTVLDIQQAADFDLIVDSRPSDQTPHLNFDTAIIEQWSEDGLYCLIGELENRGNSLNEYAVILAVLFDDQNQMLGFGEYYEPEPAEGLADFPLEFDICVDVGDQNVARYELRAWGQ